MRWLTEDVTYWDSGALSSDPVGGEDGVSATAGQRLVYPALSQLQRQPVTQPQVQVQGAGSRLVAISEQKYISFIAITKQ